MCRLYVLNKAYPVFDGYKLNTKKATIRYEFKSNAPISCKIRTLRTMKCECGNELVPLAYGYDDGLEKSRILIGENASVVEKIILQKRLYQCIHKDS